jgi:hypothetical protein
MTDVAYLCHNCGSVHEVESIRENLILDLRTAASCEPSGQRGFLGPRARFLRWRMTWGLAQALWPAYSDHAGLASGRRLVRGPPVPAAGATRLTRLVLTLPIIRGPLRRATRIQPGPALRYQ